MSIFSEAEIKEYEDMIDRAKRSVKKPQVSEILMTLTYGSVIPVEDQGDAVPWFVNDTARSLYVGSVKKMMADHEPAEFSPTEKAIMFLILQTASTYEAGMKMEDNFNKYGNLTGPDSDEDREEKESWE